MKIKKISVSLVKRKSKDNKEKWLDSEHFSLGINIVIVLQCNYYAVHLTYNIYQNIV